MLYNRIPQTGCLINNRNLFLIVLEAGKSKDNGAGSFGVWWGSASWLIVCSLLSVSLHGRGVRKLSGSSFMKALIIHEGSTLRILTSQKPSLLSLYHLIPSLWKLEFWHVKLERHRCSVYRKVQNYFLGTEVCVVRSAARMLSGYQP